jgi:hypothetical protein
MARIGGNYEVAFCDRSGPLLSFCELWKSHPPSAGCFSRSRHRDRQLRAMDESNGIGGSDAYTRSRRLLFGYQEGQHRPTAGTRSGNAASYHNRSLARRPGIALRLAYSPRVRPGRLVLAPQPRTDASCCTEHRIRRRTCTARPRRSTAELQYGWEGSGCLQECTTLRRLSRPMGGSLPSPSSMENIWEASR